MGRRVPNHNRLLAIGAALLLAGASAGDGSDAAAATARRRADPQKATPGGHVSQTFTVHNVELAKFLAECQRWGLVIPVQGHGLVTATVTVHLPWRHPLTWGDYQFDIQLESPALELEGFEFRNARAVAKYAHGRLQIEQSSFDFLDPRSLAVAGHFHGSAALQVEPRGDLTSQLHVEGLSLDVLQPLGLALPDVSGGQLTGSVQTRVPFDELRQLSAWQASGEGALRGLKFRDFPPLDGTSRFRFERGLLLLDSLSAQVGAARLTARGRVASQAPYAFQIEVPSLTADLGEWRALLPAWAADYRLGGQLQASANVRGDAQPLTWSAEGSARLSQLFADKLHVDSVQVRYTADPDRAVIQSLQAALYGGTASATGTVPLSASAPVRLALRWNRLQLGKMAGDAVGLQVAGGVSQGSVDLTIPAGKLRDVAAWQASGSAAVGELTAEGIAVRRIRGAFRLQQQSLVAAPLEVTLPQGELAAALRADLKSWQAAANYVVRDLDLSNAGQDLPAIFQPVAGQVSVTGTAQADLTKGTFSTSGTCSLRQVVLHGLRLDGAEFGFAANQFGARVANFSGRAYGGTITASGTVPFDQRVAGAVDLEYQNINGGAAAADLGWSGQGLAAMLRGAVHLQLPAGHTPNLENLQGTIQLAATGITAWGLRNGQSSLNAKVDAGVLHLSSLRVDWPEGKVRGAGRVGLAGPVDYSVQLKAAGSLPAVRLPGRGVAVPPVTGQFDVAADLRGSVRPLSMEGQGTGSLRDVHAGELALDSADFAFTADGPTLQIQRLVGRLYGGQLQGRAKISLASDQPSEAHFRVDGIDLGQLTRHAMHLPLAVEAPATAALDVEIPAEELRNFTKWDIVASGKLPDIRLNRRPLGDVVARAEYRGGVIEAQASGALVGGQLHVRAHWSPSAEETGGGIVELRGVELTRLARAFPNDRQLQKLAGRFDFSLPFTLPNPLGWPTGAGTFRASDVAWQNTVLARQISGHVKLAPARLELLDVEGDLAQGFVRGQAVYDLRNPQSRWYSLSLSGVRVEDLLVPWPQLNGSVSGRVDLRLRGTLDRISRAEGTLVMSSARGYGLDINDVILPLTLVVDPFSQAFDLSITEGAGDVAHGRTQIQVKAHWAQSLSVAVELRFNDLDPQPLLAQAGGLGSIQAGRATGTVSLAGQDVHGLNDLSGSIQARLRNIQPAGLPIFSQIQPYIAGGLGGPGFTQGNLRAHLRGGVVTLQQLAMNGPSLQVYVTGSATVAGSLDLDVFASNYTSPAGVLGPALLARLPLVATGPVGILFAVSEVLSNRVVYLDVTGTIRSPIIRVRPLPTLTNEVARFFLGGGY